MCIKKLIFLKKRPKVIAVSAKDCSLAAAAIFHVLKNLFKVAKVSGVKPSFQEIRQNEILIFEIENPVTARKFKGWLKHSSLPILVVTRLEGIASKEIEDLAKALPSFGYLVLNFDDETTREIADILNVYSLTFGFGDNADIRATDCYFTKSGTTFKLNFKGNILPIWLPNLADKKYVYPALAALSIAQIFNLNLVETSQRLRTWQLSK